MTKPIRQVWTFRSDSNPDMEYETLQYRDGTQSCSCPGWCRRVASDGARSCKHTRYVDTLIGRGPSPSSWTDLTCAESPVEHWQLDTCGGR